MLGSTEDGEWVEDSTADNSDAIEDGTSADDRQGTPWGQGML